jgi:hypothetical protein
MNEAPGSVRTSPRAKFASQPVEDILLVKDDYVSMLLYRRRLRNDLFHKSVAEPIGYQVTY